VADDLSSATPVAPRGIDFGAAAVGRFARGGPVAATSVTQAATGALAAGGIEVAGGADLRADLVITAAATTMTITIQTSFDNGVTDAWRTVAAFPAQTATGTVRQVFAGLDRWVRANVTAITGSFTFSLSGEIL
jgi:hypothetical protein